jgi:HEPN domain-containing protein
MDADASRVADTRAWVRKASSDLRAAEHEFGADPPILDDIVFHCHQAVEKTLKALLAWHDQPFRSTHNLVELGQRCAELHPELEPVLRRAAPLTEYAWKFRYPGEFEEPSREEAREAFALAREVVELILVRIPADVRS